MHCNHTYKRGLAIQNTVSPNCAHRRGVHCTMWAGGPGKLISCMKCTKCGHSIRE